MVTISYPTDDDCVESALQVREVPVYPLIAGVIHIIEHIPFRTSCARVRRVLTVTARPLTFETSVELFTTLCDIGEDFVPAIGTLFKTLGIMKVVERSRCGRITAVALVLLCRVASLTRECAVKVQLKSSLKVVDIVPVPGSCLDFERFSDNVIVRVLQVFND